MKITKEQIRKLEPCSEGWEWYLEYQTDNLTELLIKVNNNHSDWARWLVTNLMTKQQNVKIAIFSAEQVIEIFEKQFPDDNRPRAAIEAAKKYIDDQTYVARDAARDAAQAAVDAAALAAAAFYAAAAAAKAAAYAAAAAHVPGTAYAVYAVYAAEAVAAADAAANLQERIIHEAVRILEESDDEN